MHGEGLDGLAENCLVRVGQGFGDHASLQVLIDSCRTAQSVVGWCKRRQLFAFTCRTYALWQSLQR
jgi:hypothetical protein